MFLLNKANVFPMIFYFILNLFIFKVSATLNCSYGFVSNGTGCEKCGLAGFTPNLRIVGGREAIAHSWPSHVYVTMNYKTDFKFYDGKTLTITQAFGCGGTLLNHYTIITSAHCRPDSFYYIYGSSQFLISISPNKYYPTYESMFNVTFGAHNMSNISPPSFNASISKIIKYPFYDTVNHINDTMLLILSKYVEYSPYVQPACLPQKNSNTYPGPGTTVVAIGWGELSYNGPVSQVLENVLLTVYDPSYCSQYSNFPYLIINWNIQICCGNYSGGQDTCEGDSGGGIYKVDTDVMNNKIRVLVGLTGYGYLCAQPQYPGIYTRVGYFLNWIYQNWVVDNSTKRLTTTTKKVSTKIFTTIKTSTSSAKKKTNKTTTKLKKKKITA